MNKIVNRITALVKVAVDKTVDFLGFNGLDTDKPVNDESSDDALENTLDDTLDDYSEVIKVENYKDREGNKKRLFEPIGFMEEYSAFFDKPTHVVDNVYIGSAFNAASYYDLKEADVSVIVNVTKEISEYYPDDFTYLNYDVYDDNNDSISEHLEKAYQGIKHHQKNTEGNILVHCYMGSSRSASVVLYYLMKTVVNEDGELLSHDEAITLLKSKRPVVNPTFRFTKDLARSLIIK